jgi:hypothetical protein
MLFTFSFWRLRVPAPIYPWLMSNRRHGMPALPGNSEELVDVWPRVQPGGQNGGERKLFPWQFLVSCEQIMWQDLGPKFKAEMKGETKPKGLFKSYLDTQFPSGLRCLWSAFCHPLKYIWWLSVLLMPIGSLSCARSSTGKCQEGSIVRTFAWLCYVPKPSSRNIVDRSDRVEEYVTCIYTLHLPPKSVLYPMPFIFVYDFRWYLEGLGTWAVAWHPFNPQRTYWNNNGGWWMSFGHELFGNLSCHKRNLISRFHLSNKFSNLRVWNILSDLVDGEWWGCLTLDLEPKPFQVLHEPLKPVMPGKETCRWLLY